MTARRPCLVLGLALAARAYAGDAASPAPRVLEQVEAASAEAPLLMLEEDAERLLERLGPRVAPPPAPAPVSHGVSRTITVDPPPPVVNRSPEFRFRDVTERAPLDGRVRTMAERQAAVEMIRQSIAQRRARGR
jgi:hypothetical protein